MVRRFLLWALELWTGDRYVRVSLLLDAADTPLAILRAGSTAAAHAVIDDAISWANLRER